MVEKKLAETRFQRFINTARTWAPRVLIGGVILGVVAPQLSEIIEQWNSAAYLQNGALHTTLLEQIKEAGYPRTIPDDTEKEILASGGIDVKENGVWSRWEVKLAADGTVEDIIKDGKPPLGTGDFLIEDEDEGTAEPKFELQDKTSNARPLSELPAYEDVTDTLNKQGAHPYDSVKDKKYDAQIAQMMNGHTGAKHAVSGAGDAFDTVKEKGGFGDSGKPSRAWKIWVDPKHGPFFVLDKDGDSSLPYFTQIEEGTVQKPSARNWLSGEGIFLGKK